MIQIDTGMSECYGGTNSFLEITKKGTFANNDGVVVRIEDPVRADPAMACEAVAVKLPFDGGYFGVSSTLTKDCVTCSGILKAVSGRAVTPIYSHLTSTTQGIGWLQQADSR